MLHATTIFLSSFLLFLVQPLIARLILPWFGGSAAVWTTCMLFFQTVLLAGYAYAHVLHSKVSGKLQAGLHTLLLIAAVALLPIQPADVWKPLGSEEPVTRILLLLCASVGLPYFLLAATSPLLQAWYLRSNPHSNPYRLFAISNLASLGALIGYPFVVEPVFTAREQVIGWSLLFAGFAVLCAAVAWLTPLPAPQETRQQSGISKAQYLLWLCLAATGSALLLAITNHLTQNVASVPLLWLAPLTIYLLSFIITFEGKAWYQPRWAWPVVLAALGVMTWMVIDDRYHYDLAVQLAVFLPGMLIACVFCHGELYRLRPPAERLTAFYMTVSAGGAIGGLLVAVCAPLAFNGYYELGAALAAAALLAGLRFAKVSLAARIASLLVVLGVSAAAVYDGVSDQKDVLSASRTFYGVLRVKEWGEPGDEAQLRRLVHGTIMHGEQFTHEKFRRRPTSYYETTSGIGAAIESRQLRGLTRIGVIGLGTGTIAAYGRPGDFYKFYEIDPNVQRIARRDFTYLSDSEAKVAVELGDARLSLEREPPQRFDVLAVDAFSSDAIPVHLITREALAVFLRHTGTDGIVAFHVSNRFLDLIPVVARIAKENNAYAVVVHDEPEDDDESRRSRSVWVLVSRDPKALQAAPIVKAGAETPEDRKDWRTWTDDYSNLVQILR